MLANTLAPLAAVVPSYVYAEDTGASDEVSTSLEGGDKTAEGQGSVDGQTDEDEKAGVGDSDTNENKVEENGDKIENKNPGEDKDVVDPEAPDIIEGGGVSDYRPVADIEDNETVEVIDIPMPEVAPEVEAGNSAPVESIEAPSAPENVVKEKEYEYLEEGAEVKDSVKEDWSIDGEVAKTIEKVKLGVKYVFPLDEEVSVTFKKLPKLDEDRGYLKIERVKVEDLKLPDDFRTNAEYAFDITIVDENGNPCEDGLMENEKDFEYDLTLPKPKGVEVGVVYIEKDLEEVKEEKLKTEEIKEIEEDKVDQKKDGEKVEVGGLDHFTIYIATYHCDEFWLWPGHCSEPHIIEQTQYHNGEVVDAYASGLPKDFYRIDIINPSNLSVANSSSDTCNSKSASVSYTYRIKDTDAIGTGWKVVLSGFDTTSNCNNNTGVIDTATDYFEVTPKSTPTPSQNPLLSDSCGLDIALVIDNSNSISDSELGQMKNALKEFVDALTGTPTQFSVTKFGTNATVVQEFTSDATLTKNAINSVTTGGKGTNWENAFNKARATFDPRTDEPNLIIFASDGNPTYPNCGGGITCSDDVNAAIIEANHAKGIPARILAIGIGDELNVDNLKAISGGTVNGDDISKTDVITTDFAGMAAKLSAFATKTCGGTISVNKYIDTISDSTRGGAGWNYTVTGPSSYSKTLTTDGSGQANTGTVSTGSDYTITESNMLSGYSYGSAICKNQNGDVVGSEIANGWGNISISNDDIIICDFVNTANYTETKICHATAAPKNPYVSESPSTLGQLMGHAGHTGPVWYTGISVQWGDIIPPITVFLPSGLNWSTEGQAIWNNNCNIPSQTGTIELKKVWLGTPGQTTLKIGTSINGLEIDSQLTGADGTSDLTTGQNIVPTGTYYLSESGGLDNYTSSLACFNDTNGNGSQDAGESAVVAVGTNDSVSVAKGDHIICSYTNTYTYVPYCGDSHKDAGEECDGTDGVGANQFCTSACKLVNIYDGGNSCPAGSTPVEINSLTINSKDDPAGKTTAVSAGKDYLFEAIGDYGYGGASGNNTVHRADAGYATAENAPAAWDSLDTRFGITAGAAYRGVTSLLSDWGTGIMGIVGWGTYTTSHIYQKAYHATSDADVKFVISDWYSDWYNGGVNNNQGGMWDNKGSLTLNVYECQPVSEVTICKEDDRGNKLSDWRVALLGDEKNTFSVQSNGTSVTKSYPAGSYVVQASGTYNYGNNVMNADAANSFRYAGLSCSDGVDKWVNGDSDCMNHYLNLNPSLNGGPMEAGWGNFFNPEHIYYKAFAGGDLNFKIWDSCGTSDEGCYGDNEGNVGVAVYKGYAGDTGENGCVTFSGVPYGTYNVKETMQDGWATVSVLGEVVVDESSETITITNRLLPTSGDLTICKYNDLDRDGIVDEGEPKVQWGMVVKDANDQYVSGVEKHSTPNNSSCLVLEDLALGTYTVTEDQINGWTKTYPVNDYSQTVTLDVNNPNVTVNFLNYQNPEVTVVATKIVCDYETDLPNWGTGGPDVTANTAQDFLSAHSNCHAESGWNFQWGDDGDVNPGDSVIGEADGWNTFGPTDANGVAAVDITNYGSTSQIKVREVLKENYIPFTYTTSGNQNSNPVSAELYCDTDVLNYDNDDRFTPEYGQTYYCVAWNTLKRSDIYGYKWSDLNGNGKRDCVSTGLAPKAMEVPGQKECDLEPLLSDWKVFIDKNGNGTWDEGEDFRITSTSEPIGKYSFEQLPAGQTYKICEVPQTGWTRTSPKDSNCSEVEIKGGDSITVDFGNHYIPSKLSISKFNDASGPKKIGDTVEFTIKVTAHDNSVSEVHVYDLFSEGFEYVDNSWEAASNKNSGLVVGEPTYASPADWSLGSMLVGETITLTYRAKVTEDIDPGIYNDIAWTQGTDYYGGILGYAEEGENSGKLAENFVGTQVEVEKETPLETDVDVKEEKKEKEGEVLGASTSMGLPATGASTIWVKLISVIAFVGALLLIIGGLEKMFNKKKATAKSGKNVLTRLILIGLFAFVTTKAYAASTMVRLSQPKSPATSTFDLVFVAMDINSSPRNLLAECFVQKPGDLDFSATPFHTESISSGNVGDSKICPVNSSVLGSEGTYTFKVKVTPEGGSSVPSNEVTVEYDSIGPDKPEYIKKEKVNDCVNKIKVKTADDGETASIKVYADDDKEVDIDDSHRIETETIGPGEKFEFEHIVSGGDCDKDWYYAVVAFDNSGNASSPRAETITAYTEGETKTEEKTEEETGAIPVEGGAGLPGEGAVAGEQTSGEEGVGQEEGKTEGVGEEGSVLGEQTSEVSGSKSIFKSPWFWIGLAGLGIIIFSVSKKSKKAQR